MTTIQVIAAFLFATGGAHVGFALGMVTCPRKPSSPLAISLAAVGAVLLIVGVQLVTK